VTVRENAGLSLPGTSVAISAGLLFSFAFAFAQTPLATVRVTVKADDAPVAAASVRINGASVLTGDDGVASAQVPLGAVEITVSKEDFFTAKTSVDVNEARDWLVSVDLKPREEHSEQITVSATRTDSKIEDTPTRVEVIARDEIEEESMMTPGNIVMMLNEMAGLRVQNTSPSLGAASVRIQGMRGRYTAFLGDGLPLFGQEGGGIGLLQIPPIDLGQVEVIKGVASAMYGAGAMSGVVDLISRRPDSEPVHEFLFNQSTRGATDASVFLAQQLNSHWGASFLGSGDWQQINDINHDGWADLAGYSRGVVRPRLFFDSGDGWTGFLTGGFTYETREGGTIPGSFLPATGAPYIESLLTHRYDLGGNLQKVLKKKYLVAARFSSTWQDHDHHFGDIRERDRHQLLFGELTARGTFHRNTWVIGAAAERDAFIPTDVPRFTYRYTTPAIFAQDDLEVASWLSLSASARVDFQNQFGTFFSPRIAALIRWHGWISRFSAGGGFFAPTPLTEETEAAGLTRLTIPKPLVAERGRSSSIDLSRKIGLFNYTVTFFDSTVDHPIDVERGAVYQLVNLSQPTHNVGAEFLGTLRKNAFSATLSYTYVHSRQFEFNQRVDTPLTPRHSAGIVGMWEKEKIGRIGVESYYTGIQRLEDNPYRTESKPYMLFGFLAEHPIGPFSLFINMENLTNVRQTRWDPLLRPEQAVDGRWTVDAWSPLDGRVLNGGVRIRF
jgi:outer membrane receptor for ferrienterochelin and colicins